RRPSVHRSLLASLSSLFFFFTDTPTTEIYTLSLHDALPISVAGYQAELAAIDTNLGWALSATGKASEALEAFSRARMSLERIVADRKSTRLNSSHSQISYAVFCLKKKKKKTEKHDKNTNICT